MFPMMPPRPRPPAIDADQETIQRWRREGDHWLAHCKMHEHSMRVAALGSCLGIILIACFSIYLMFWS